MLVYHVVWLYVLSDKYTLYMYAYIVYTHVHIHTYSHMKELCFVLLRQRLLMNIRLD